MKKQNLLLSLLLSGGLMLAVGPGCDRADAPEAPPVPAYEEPRPGIYEEDAPAAPAPSYGLPEPDPAPAPAPAPAPGYGMPEPESAPEPAPGYGY